MVRNLARQKLVAQFILGLLKSRDVQFCEVAQHLNNAVKMTSSETRIQDFFREADLNYLVLAQLLLSLLPAQGKPCPLARFVQRLLDWLSKQLLNRYITELVG